MADRLNFDVSMTTAHQCLKRVIAALYWDVGPAVVAWQGDRRRSVVTGFSGISGRFPRIIDASDGCHIQITAPHARFTLADPMPRLASDVVGGKSGRNHPTSRRDPIQIGRVARNVYIRVGWCQGVVQYCATPWLVR